MAKKRIAVLGSTGSIGTQALDVIQQHPDRFEIAALTTNSNVELLVKQSAQFEPAAVGICKTPTSTAGTEELRNVEVLQGPSSLDEIVQRSDIDLVIAAVVGFAGLSSTLKAIESGKDVALANKETLVVAGDIVTKAAKRSQAKLIPIDSEHSAVFQCLAGEDISSVEKITITASGGPFRGKNREFLKSVTVQQALNHPNWDMGDKITIDSATLMNKGLEIIEAHWLFGLEPEQIEVVVHPQSVIHSMVHFKEGSVKAQLGAPDMRAPILYALSYPDRVASALPRFNWSEYPELSFEAPDEQTFPCLRLAKQALAIGGTAPCVLNAANEVAVNAFLASEIGFTEIPELISGALEDADINPKPELDDYIETDKATRDFVSAQVASRAHA